MSQEEIHGSTSGGLEPERVEDRPGVSSVKPEDYPDQSRKEAGLGEDLDEDQEYERLHPGSAGTVARSDSGTDRDLA